MYKTGGRYRDRPPGLLGAPALVAALLVGLAPVGPLKGQSLATGSISGRIVDDVTGRGVPMARITLAPTFEGLDVYGQPTGGAATRRIAELRGLTLPQEVVTGSTGEFRFEGLLPGRYMLNILHPFYWGALQERPGGVGYVMVVVGAGEEVAGVRLLAWKTATVSGQVFDERGEPVVGAEVVALRRVGVGGRVLYESDQRASTDDTGRYEITTLRPATYVVAAPNTAVTQPPVGDLDNSGDPADPLEQLEQAARSGGLLGREQGVSVGDLWLDWRGAPGYVEQANGGAVPFSYGAQFYPGVPTLAGAAELDLDSQRDATGIDFRITPRATQRVSGRVVGPDGPAPWIGVRLISEDMNGVRHMEGLETGWTATDADGQFTFLGIPPGRYRVVARVAENEWMSRMNSPDFSLLRLQAVGSAIFLPGRSADSPILWAEAPVVLDDADVDGVALELKPGARVRGRIEFRGATPPPDDEQVARMLVYLQPLDTDVSGALSRAPVRGQFESAQYPPGRYDVKVREFDPNWMVERIEIDGQDYYDRALQLDEWDVDDVVVVMTDQPATLSGSVQPRPGDTEVRATVVVVPADTESWIANGMIERVARKVTTTTSGAFSVARLRPGAYRVVAIAGELGIDIRDPDFVRRVVRFGVEVTAAPGLNAVPRLDRVRAGS